VIALSHRSRFHLYYCTFQLIYTPYAFSVVFKLIPYSDGRDKRIRVLPQTKRNQIEAPMGEIRPAYMLTIPWWRPRFFSGTRSVTAIDATVVTPPPPMPAAVRAAIRISIDGAKPHSNVPEPNNDDANSVALLRPRMSDSLPYNGVKQHTDSKYAVPM